MERFTEKFKDGRNILRKGITDIFHVGFGRFFEGESIDKLAEYEDLEEQGKLLKLPCAVGDILYSVSFRKKCCKMGNTYFVNDDLQCAFCESESVCNSKIEYFIEEINATLPIITNLIDRPDGFMIFLTKSDAETALKEREGKNGKPERKTATCTADG